MKKANSHKCGAMFALALLLVGPPAGRAAQENVDVCQAADRALSQGQLQEALSLYQTCRQQSAPRFETLSNLGIVYTRLGEFNEAIGAYQQALALDPQNPQLNTNLGLAFFKSARYDEAARAFARALLVQPDNSQVEELLALCYYQLEQYELAAVEAERVYRAKPDADSAAFLLGSAYLKLQFYDKAISLIDSVLRKTDSAKTHAILAEAYLGVRAFGKALEEFTRALELEPDMPGLHSRIGAAFVGLGNPERAAEEFQKELARNPNDFDSNYHLGRLKRLSNDNEAASRYLAKAAQLRPGDASVLNEYAIFALQAKDYVKAEALLRQVLEKYPNYTDAHVLLSQVYFRTGRQEEGEQHKSIVEALQKAEKARQSALDNKIGQADGGSSSPHLVDP